MIHNKSTTIAMSISFAGAMKANGLHLLLELPRKQTDLIRLRLPPTKQVDHLPTLPNAKHSQIIQML
jgi:hypothetical protein